MGDSFDVIPAKARIQSWEQRAQTQSERYSGNRAGIFPLNQPERNNS